jgi:hypothetical protein
VIEVETYRNEGPLWPCGCLVGNPACRCGADTEQAGRTEWGIRYRDGHVEALHVFTDGPHVPHHTADVGAELVSRLDGGDWTPDQLPTPKETPTP